jgi:enoyl-CoA hydratase/carnithine racemase
MPFETLTVDRDTGLPGLVTVTLNRPAKLNPINNRMHRDVIAFCQEMEEDSAARVVIFTGAGRAFSAGADLGSARNRPTGEPPPMAIGEDALANRIGAKLGNRSSAAIEGLPQVTIGAVNGLAVGGAVVWLACMDIRLAAESAWFSIP